MRSTFLGLFAVAVLGGAGICQPTLATDGEVIESLRKERLATLRSLLEVVTQRNKEGVGDILPVLDAQHRVLAAEIELTASVNERIKVHAAIVENLRRKESILSRRLQEGTVGTLIEAALAAKANRLEAEIQLQQYKLANPAASANVEELDGLPLVFSEDFDQGQDRWELTDENAWTLREVGGNHVFGLNKRISDYEPEFRSPHNIALVKDLELTDFAITFKVKSTNDTGNHRDCCVFFSYTDPTHFYYCHLGARPDPHSGQIMIVNEAPRLALTENTNRTPWSDQWHRVKVTRNSQDGRIKVYFDDMENVHMEVKDTRFGTGRIGIGSFDDMNDFDEIRIYGK